MSSAGKDADIAPGAEELLKHLGENQIELWAEGENLRYSAPKGALTGELADLIRRNKPALLESLRQPRRAASSFNQANIWSREQIQPQSRLFNLVEGLRLRGALNLAALEASLNEIVRRHAILRTTYAYLENEQEQDVFQIIQPYQPDRLPCLDLSALPEAQRAEAARKAAFDQAWAPFDLANQPGFRPSLVRLAVEEHLLLLKFHLIVIDGWSVGLLLQELSRFYLLHSQGGAQASAIQRPPALRAQYADFAAWQRAALPELLAQHLPYWEARMQHTPPSIPLPFDRARPAHPTGRADSAELHLAGEHLAALNDFARQQEVTLYALLLAVLAVQMAQLSGQEQFWLGSPTSYRSRTEFEPLIGRMVNTLLVRADLAGNPGWGELARRMQRSALESFEHQDLPFEELLPALKFKRGPQDAPLPQVTLNLHNYPLSAELDLPGIKADFYDVPLYPAHADLQFHARPRREGLHIKLLYDRDIFDASSAARILETTGELLKSCLVDPAPKLDLPAAQAQPVLVSSPEPQPARQLSAFEARLCALAAESLGLEQARLEDSFFALGSNSLRAARFLSLLYARLGVSLPLTSLYDYATLGEIAQVVRRDYPELEQVMPDTY